MSETATMLEANAAYVAGFSEGNKPMPPARSVAAVVCMDARIHPSEMLGLTLGDAHVIRNAGGRVSDDTIRSLIISSTLLGTKEFIVVHHTDCGMLTFSNDDLRGILAERRGSDASDIDFLPFGDLEQSVRDDIATIRASEHLDQSIPVRGFVYDVDTGALHEVN